MGAFTTSEFTSLLDELIAKTAREEDEPARPSVSFGFVAPSDAVEELWANVPDDFVANIYRNAGFREALAQTPGLETPEPQAAPLPPIDPASIASELRMVHARFPKDFDRIRREFALANHPDRVEVELRDRAVVRMQIANMLIDQEKRKLTGRK